MKFFCVWVVVLFLMVVKGMAQPAVSVHGSYGFSNQSVISDGMYGGGIQLRYFVSSSIALGVSAKYYAEYLSREVASKEIKANTKDIPVNILIEYYLRRKGVFRPYVGVEGGIHYLSINEIRDTKAEKKESSSAKFGVSPKVGLQVFLGKRMGIFAEAVGTFVTGKENFIHLDASNPNNINYRLKNSPQSLMFNLGLVYGLEKKQRKRKDAWDEPVPGQVIEK